jgi:hypothetical protein
MEELALDQSAAKLQAFLLVQRRLRWARQPHHRTPTTTLSALPLLFSLLLLWLTKLIVLDPLLS